MPKTFIVDEVLMTRSEFDQTDSRDIYCALLATLSGLPKVISLEHDSDFNEFITIHDYVK